MATPFQLFKQWQSIREYAGDRDAFEMLIADRDATWRKYVIDQRWDAHVATRDAARRGDSGGA